MCCRVEKSSLKNSCANKMCNVDGRWGWKIGWQFCRRLQPGLQLRNGVVVVVVRYGCDGGWRGGMGGQY